MLRGTNEVATLRLNGWGVGDILEGTDITGTDCIVITAIGATNFLCRWVIRRTGKLGIESSNTTLNAREWKKIGNIFDDLTIELPPPIPRKQK